MKIYFYIALIIFFKSIAPAFSQQAVIKGQVTENEIPIAYATIGISQTTIGTVSNFSGLFELKNLQAGKYEITVSYVGYISHTELVSVQEGQVVELNIKLQKDLLQLNDLVITATREAIPMYQSPIIISRINDKIFEKTQSLSLSEGLNFSPGLRLENNCQNCGFSQVRMNGLAGPYTQILINSRPVFSALVGVYGLDMIPSNMIDRVEVTRGGGSVLYGGNAIAGTVNIITKEPISNAFEVGTNIAYTNFESPDRTIHFNGSIVSDDLKKGLSFYGYNRKRAEWDANNDGFSEITKLQNNTIGFDAFYKPDSRSKIKFNTFSINEFRRGGSHFDLEPHQASIAEQLQHNILGVSLSYERYSLDLKRKYSLYTSTQYTNRNSYYGAGGRVIQAGDSISNSDLLALNAYGNAVDVTAVGGGQFSQEINKKLNLTLGSEIQHNKVNDNMPGYKRIIDQEVNVIGTYAQLSMKLFPKTTLIAGGRFDYVDIHYNFKLANENTLDKKSMQVAVPRLSMMHEFTKDLKLRAAFAQGYRAPQAFYEDLHLETAGGDVRFIVLDKNLKTEKSNSVNASINYTKIKGKTQANFVVEAFYTQLLNPFITANQTQLENGATILTKRNGSGATVQGFNTEINVAHTKKLSMQIGATIQKATYHEEEEIWIPENLTESNKDSIVSTTNMLRTPNIYGFFSASYTPIKQLDFSLSGVYTGSMELAHLISPETNYTILKKTPDFFELNSKVAYTFNLEKDYYIQVFGGLQNIFNAYQSDFDSGMYRDGSYVYGPTRPRTVFVGVKLGFN